MGSMACPESQLNNYRSMLRNLIEERRSLLRRSGTLKTEHSPDYKQTAEEISKFYGKQTLIKR
jgi:hypothetical protein